MSDDIELEPTDELITADFESVIELRDAAKREVTVRVVPFGVVGESKRGPEVWEQGASAGNDPGSMDIRLEHDGRPVGVGKALEERADGVYATFRVSKTQAGDELLELARDGVYRHVSGAFYDTAPHVEKRDGRRTNVVRAARMHHVALTRMPTWEQSAILSVRSRESTGAPNVETPTPTEIIPVAQAFDPNAMTSAIAAGFEGVVKGQTDMIDRVIGRLEALEERSRRDGIIIPGAPSKKPVQVHEWMSYAIRTLAGEKISPRELQERDLDDIITPDNPGGVPEAFVNDLIGIVDRSRPFLQSTRQIPPPDTGMSITVPVLTQRATAGAQSGEKQAIDSTATKVTTREFAAVTIAGGADVSLQILKRATSSFLALLNEDLAAAYAAEAEAQALATLFDAPTTPGSGNIDPEDLEIGEAWENSINAINTPPDTIWLSAAAVKEFIDAKNDGTNAPLYFRLNASFGVGNAPAGDVSALRPVYVPALTGTGVDVIIGPSRGFAWAEDGTFNLEVDVPSKLGRDIALAGIMWFIPRYAAAFTTYDLGS